MEIGALERVQGYASAPVPAESPREAAERRELIRAVRAVDKAQLYGSDNELTFSLDRESRRTVVRIVNRETKEVVRQIPPKEVLALAERLRDSNSEE